MRWCTQPGESPLFGPERGCAEFEQRLLRFDGRSVERSHRDDDELLYVLSGSGAATIGSAYVGLSERWAAYVARGTRWRVDNADGLEILSVLVRNTSAADGVGHAVIAPDETRASRATAGRQFRLLATPERGCASATQFIGYIPAGRAPDHYHTYDEVVYVLEGEGALHVGHETAALRAGSCLYLPARLVHCLENTGPGELRVLGVFRPAGSPAEAYYPDGTPAMY
jgi:mannose-6-phosphate isomerase-like protein (cupin superfamily)